jgi:hypothetical protein
MSIDNILGKVVAITRGIHLIPLPSPARIDVFTPSGFRQVQWWFQQNAIVQTRELAEMIQMLDSEYAAASVAAIQLEIDRVLKESFLDRALFDLRKITTSKSTLFDAALGDAKDFARRLWERILSAVKDLQPTWLILYPLRGVISNSFDIGFDGLSVMAPTDTNTWQSYSSRYPRTTDFTPAEGSPEQFSTPSVWGIESPTADPDRRFTWLICETKGTQSGVSRIAAGRMRTFLALLFAQWHPRDADFFVIKSDLPEHRCSLQFARSGNRAEDAIACGTIGRLMPSLPIDFGISANNISQVRRWYSARATSDEETQRRALTASHYIHHAIMSDGFERFIHYYISLDAMFGERYKVEETIKKALLKMFPNDSAWEYRADRLFDLRNALVHGGTSTIDGWKGLKAYMRHLKTSPMEDVGRAAMTGLRNYFE